MATSLTSGKLTVNSLGLMDWKAVTTTHPDEQYPNRTSYSLPSGGNWIYIVNVSQSSNKVASAGFSIKAGGSTYVSGYPENSNVVVYSIRFS